MAHAIAELGIPRVKGVNPVSSYRGQLTLGDPQSNKGIVSIDVERYPRTMVAKPPSASSFVVRSDVLGPGASTQSSRTLTSKDAAADGDDPTGAGSNLTAVKNNRVYQVDDESVAGGKRELQRDELAKGYEYGRTAVHISESDENVTRLETHAGLEVIGFVPREKVCSTSMRLSVNVAEYAVVSTVYEHVGGVRRHCGQSQRSSQHGAVILRSWSVRAGRLRHSTARHQGGQAARGGADGSVDRSRLRVSDRRPITIRRGCQTLSVPSARPDPDRLGQSPDGAS